MTNQLKSRAWDREQKKMSYSKIEWFDDMIGFRFDHFGLEPEINVEISWFTGFQDKNKKDIYAEDILGYRNIYDNKDCVVRVYFDHKVGAWYAGDNFLSRLIHQQTVIAESQNFRPDYPRIIGNIYQNPELLK